MSEDDASELWTAHDRYAALRVRFQAAALNTVLRPKLREIALRLGLPVDGDGAQIADSDMAFAYDLAVHTGPEGRSRAIDRVARQRRGESGDAARVLEALVDSRFSIFRVREPHPLAGLVLEDVLLGGEAWLIDRHVAEVAPIGSLIATRLAQVADFAISCGAVAPLDDLMLARIRRIVADTGLDPALLLGDARFQTVIYQRALGFAADEDDGPA